MLRLLAFLLVSLTTCCATARAGARFASDRVSLEVRGSGPDVILIPGLCSDPEVWDGTVTGVPGYRYHLVHLAGFAGKPAGANATGPVLAPVAEEIVRYIRQAHLKRPALVGHSLGGVLAIMVAARHPRLTSRVMVVDAFPFAGVMYGPPGTTSDSIRPVAEKMRKQFGTKTGEARLRSIEETVASMTQNEAARRMIVKQTLACDTAAAREAYYEVLTTDLRPELRNVRVPTVVLWAYPPGVPLKPDQLEHEFRQSYANAPQTTIKQVPDAWHYIMLDQPQTFQQELRQFLKRRH